MMRNGRNQGTLGVLTPGGLRPGAGGMMPGALGSRKMPGMPELDDGNWEVPRSRSMPRGNGSGANESPSRVQNPAMGKLASLSSKYLPQGSDVVIPGRSALLQGAAAAPPSQPDNSISVKESISESSNSKPLPVPKSFPPDLQRKTVSLLEEYFSVLLLDEALQCVQELKAASYHPLFVREAISLALEKSPPCLEPVAQLLSHLFNKNTLTAIDIETGCISYGSTLDDIGIDLPKAPSNFGKLLGKLIISNATYFKVVKEVLGKVEDDRFRAAIFGAARSIIKSSPSGEAVLTTQGADIQLCESLLSV